MKIEIVMILGIVSYKFHDILLLLVIVYNYRDDCVIVRSR